MLAPDIFTTNNQLIAVFNEVKGLNGYSFGVQDTQIGTLPMEPKWLPEVKAEMKLLATAGSKWIIEYPPIWASLITTFIDYATTMTAVSEEITKNLDNISSKQCVKLLGALSTSLAKNATTTQASLTAFSEFENNFTNVFPSISKSIQAGWNELAGEEKEMMAIAVAMTELQDEINQLQSKITADAISNGKSFSQTSVTIIYDIVTATGELAVPYLSIVSIAITIGKTFYDVITDTEKINEDLKKIGALQLKASEEAQALGATKATLQYLYGIEIHFLTLQKHGNGLHTMWINEKEKVDEAINAINSGADPKEFLAMMTLHIASKNWSTIQQFAQKFMDLNPKIGKPVILKTVETNKNK